MLMSRFKIKSEDPEIHISLLGTRKIKVKVKIFLLQAMEAYRVARG
jgi:hypothetical protein